jgi:UPF0176 protein
VTSILNVSAYRFVELSDTTQWRESIRSQARTHSLKGTVLLATEGINLVVAGSELGVREFFAWLTAHDEFVGLPVKESWSSAAPFAKLLVKVKREIIRMDDAAIRPQAERAPAVDAATLARWLDAGTDDHGRPVVMLDTRNGFEVDAGRFEGALDWRLRKFSDFPRALLEHRNALAGKTVVSYCTGGIRCEKAALLMAQSGVANVLQLEGGILKYFETVGAKHFEGNCFVFDQRDMLNDTLAPVPAV